MVPSFTVYRKPTHSDRYLNYHSFHTHSHNIPVIDSLVTRALSVCSKNNLETELNYIISKLILNDYPKHLIQKRIKILKEKPQKIEEETRLVLPYMGNLTYQIARTIKSKIPTSFGYLTGRKISEILVKNHKDTIKKSECGIYKLTCNECNACYIGETKRDFKTRLKEHEADIRHNRILTSAVALHYTEFPDRSINKNKSSLIELEARNFQRKYKESLYIRSIPKKMNLDNGIQIHDNWSSLIIPLLKSPK